MIGHPSETVLILDPDDAVRDLLTQALRYIGYDVISCTDDAEAIDVLRSQAPDLVMLDPGPNGLPGREVLMAIEASPSLEDVPVLFCETTPWHRDALPQRPRSRVWGALAKPFDLDELFDTVNALVERAPRESVPDLHEPRRIYESLAESVSDRYSPHVTAQTAS
jgi:DNA-binding response OmpR family regulator